MIIQLLQFQKKKQGTKKKKKREKSGGSVASAASGSEASEGPTSDGQLQDNLKQQPVEHEAKPKKKKKQTEDISQADTDHDASSIHSDQGSPIPFDQVLRADLQCT